MDLGLKGKIALVAAASRGLGRAVANELAAEGAALVIAVLLLLLGLVLAVPLILTYLETGLVPRVPTAILITGLGIIAVLCLFAGLILDTVTRGRREVRRLAYLAHAPPGQV